MVPMILFRFGPRFWDQVLENAHGENPQVFASSCFWEPSCLTLSVPLEGGRNPSLSLDERLLGVCMCVRVVMVENCGHSCVFLDLFLESGKFEPTKNPQMNYYYIGGIFF